ncbi:hypothetical protein [Nannocystis exedens]|uniref:hypothetical protein n=1 Tax=Nannocystis exedens TaxID=54 RepID=UPI0011604004|nr:hypothetical protein [Nannocystis exedens]
MTSSTDPRPRVAHLRPCGPPTLLYSMLDGTPARNLLGYGDPCVARVDGRWTMFVGGFQLDLRNNLYALQLPEGDELDSPAWSFVTAPGRPGRAQPLVPQPRRDEWDHHGLHTPSYVRGRVGDAEVERIYYAGRGSYRVVDNVAPYGIGVMTRRDGTWARHPTPILRGSPTSPNVLEPKAAYLNGKWRVWYTTTPQEAGKRAPVRYRIEYVESDDGVTGWSAPVVVFDEEEGYYDAAVTASPPGAAGAYTMLLCRSTNLYGRSPFPEQGMWLAAGGEEFGARANWQIAASPLIRCDAAAPEWYRHGPFGPSLVALDRPTRRGVAACVFFSGVDSRRNWARLALRNLGRGKLPPPPAPFFFTLGRLDLTPG